MKKTQILWWAIRLIFIIVFNVVVFLIIEDFTMSFWVSYGFIHFAYLMLLFSSLSSPRVKDKFVFGYPLIYLSIFYFVLEFLIGIIFMIFKTATFNVSFIPQFILAAIFGIIYIFNMIGNETSIASEKESARNIFFIKNATSEINLLMSQVSDIPLRKRLEKLYDSIRSSQVKSDPALAGIEANIMVKIEKIREQISERDFKNVIITIDEIMALVSERNSKIAMLR